MRKNTDKPPVNIGYAQRLVSTVLGLAFSAYGLKRSSGLKKLIIPAIGASLLQRGVSGHCALKGALGNGHFSLKKALLVSKGSQHILSHWNEIKRLLPFLTNARIVEERRGELLEWESTASDGKHYVGKMQCNPKNGSGTELAMSVEMNSDQNPISVTIEKLLGSEFKNTIERSLKQAKQLLESGEIPTTKGQSSGRKNLRH